MWTEKGWTFNSTVNDERDPMTRAMEEIEKTLNSTVNFLSFTTESEADLKNGFLPTSDISSIYI